jgi:hypothetical protein
VSQARVTTTALEVLIEANPSARISSQVLEVVHSAGRSPAAATVAVRETTGDRDRHVLTPRAGTSVCRRRSGTPARLAPNL